MVKRRKKARRFRVEEFEGHYRKVRIRDEVAIKRYSVCRQRLFSKFFGEKVTDWCADNNVPFYNRGVQQLIRKRRDSIRVLIKFLGKTVEEAIKIEDDALYDKGLRLFIEREHPELENISIGMWSRTEIEDFEAEYPYNIYRIGSP